MLAWLSANLLNLALTAVLVLIAGLAIRTLIRNRKAGKCSCGCSCGQRGGCAACGKKPE